MEFKIFAKKLKNVIGGKSNTKIFTKTIFETMMNESGPDLLESTKLATFKSYYNGHANISRIAALVLSNLNDDDGFATYLEGFGDTAAQLLADEFIDDIPEVTAVNAPILITDLFLDILRNASSNKKSTPKSAKKNNDKIRIPIQTVKLNQTAVDEISSTHCLDEEKLNQKDLTFLDRFKTQVEPILTYCMDHDPAGEGTKLSLADEINDFLQSWKYDVQKVQDACFRKIVIDTINVLEDYTYYLSYKFLRRIPNMNILWFRNESLEEGNQLRNILRSETLKKRTEMKDIYVRIYPIPKDYTDKKTLEIPEAMISNNIPYSLEDIELLQEFTSDYDKIMLTIIGDNFSTSLIDMTIPCKIKELFESKWNKKINDFIDLSLKSNVLALLGELNTISKYPFQPHLLRTTRTKIRNLYVKLHPHSFDSSVPYDAFIDDWNDGEY